MTTLNEMIETIKAENPNGLRIGSDETGYTDLTATEYEMQIAEWAQGRLDKQARLAEAELAAQAKADAVDKLTALGIDPKALGL
jgi:hypothetical protein